MSTAIAREATQRDPTVAPDRTPASVVASAMVASPTVATVAPAAASEVASVASAAVASAAVATVVSQDGEEIGDLV